MAGGFRWLLDHGGNPIIVILWDHVALVVDWLLTLCVGCKEPKGPDAEEAAPTVEVRCAVRSRGLGSQIS